MKKLILGMLFGEMGVAIAAPTGVFDIALQAFLLCCYAFFGYKHIKQSFRNEAKNSGNGN